MIRANRKTRSRNVFKAVSHASKLFFDGALRNPLPQTNSTARVARVKEGSHQSSCQGRDSNNAMLPFRCLKTVITQRPKPTCAMYVHSFSRQPESQSHDRRAAAPKHRPASPSLSIRTSHTRASPNQAILCSKKRRDPGIANSTGTKRWGNLVIQQQEGDMQSLERSACKSDIAFEGEKAHPPKTPSQPVRRHPTPSQ
jgi:hypothetical protein